MKYGSFIGDADPVAGADGSTPDQLLEFAFDRIEDELLTPEQTLGVIRYAQDIERVKTGQAL